MLRCRLPMKTCTGCAMCCGSRWARPWTAFNERDGEFLCRIDTLRRSHGALKAIEQRRAPEPGPDVWLVFAPIKRARLEWVVEKATELRGGRAGSGGDRAYAVGTRQSRAAAGDRHCRFRAERAHVASRDPPRGAARAPARRLARRPAPRPVRRERRGPADRRGARRVPAGAAPAAVLVGPEGGFAETELDALGKLSIVTRVGLGPRILRAETAALAALAVYQAIAGDWRLVRRRAERRQSVTIGGFGSRMSGPSSLQGPQITDKRELVEYHKHGGKPPAAWRIGTEHKKFVFRRADLKRAPYEGPDGIGALLRRMTRSAGSRSLKGAM